MPEESWWKKHDWTDGGGVRFEESPLTWHYGGRMVTVWVEEAVLYTHKLISYYGQGKGYDLE